MTNTSEVVAVTGSGDDAGDTNFGLYVLFCLTLADTLLYSCVCFYFKNWISRKTKMVLSGTLTLLWGTFIIKCLSSDDNPFSCCLTVACSIAAVCALTQFVLNVESLYWFYEGRFKDMRVVRQGFSRMFYFEVHL